MENGDEFAAMWDCFTRFGHAAHPRSPHHAGNSLTKSNMAALVLTTLPARAFPVDVRSIHRFFLFARFGIRAVKLQFARRYPAWRCRKAGWVPAKLQFGRRRCVEDN